MQNFPKKWLLLAGIIVFGSIFLYTQAQQDTGELRLEILAGNSCCVYGTSVVFGDKDISFGITEFSGDFLSYHGTTSRGCKDLLGTETGWVMYIAMSGDMENENGNKIGSGNVKISFDGTTLVGGNCDYTLNSGTDIGLSSSVSLVEKTDTPTNFGKICELGTTNVKLKVVTNIGQAPGNYQGTLVIDLPSFANSSCEGLVGIFYDSETDGLAYIGDQGSVGVTSNGGQFDYKPGEQITFSVGTLILGNPVTPAANGSVFVTDLFGLARTEITDANVIKVGKLLQGLDEDNNPDNGITITESTSLQITENSNISSLDVDAKLNILSRPIRTNTQIVQHLKDTAVTKLDQELNIEFSWVKTGTWLNNDEVKGTITDGSGNTYIVGKFGNTGFFGTTTLISSGINEIYIAKVDKSGNWIWAENLGGYGPEYLKKMNIDKYGNVYIMGAFSFKFDKTFGTTTLTTDGSNVYIVKLDKDGNLLRAKQQGIEIDGIVYNISHNYVGGITIDDLGNIYTVSSLRSITGTGTDLYIAKVDKDGNWLRAKSGGGISEDYAYVELITVDLLGNSYIAGDFSGTIILGGTTLVSDGQRDAYIAKMDSNGNWLRARKAGGTDENTDYIFVKGIAIDKLNNNYIAGDFSGTIILGGTTLVSDGQRDAYIAKMDSNGNWLRAKSGGGEYDDSIESITIDELGNCNVIGTFQLTGIFGEDVLVSPYWSEENAYIAKLDTNGNWISSNMIEGITSEAFFIDNSKNAYIVGMTDIDLGGIGVFENIGLNEKFIYKIASRNIDEKLRGSIPGEGYGGEM